MKKISSIQIMSLMCMAFLWIGTACAQECTSCHDAGEFEGHVVHGPVQAGDCTTCHAPHAARYQKLLKEGTPSLCFRCHPQMEKELESNTVLHEPLRTGDCAACHAPHASDSKGLLAAEGAEACLLCHADLNQVFAVKHIPFAQGNCDACHDPHGGQDGRLLQKEGAALCLGCHQENARLRRTHQNRGLETMECLSCHHPHGSATRSLLREVRHQPFETGNCQGCHSGGGKPDCLSCHEDVRSTFYGVHSHFGDGRNCLSCHNPHVGDRPGMLPKDQRILCQSCHADTLERRQEALHRHPKWKTCTDCHDLHSSDRLSMLKEEPDKLCAGCHDEHATFTHPIGEHAKDPRNDLPMTCTSCHDANTGTMFEYNLRGGRERGLCIPCHPNH